MEPGEVRAAVWGGLLATFVATVAGYWFPAIGLPSLDFASLNGNLLVPTDASIDLIWTMGLLQLFGGGVVVSLLYGLYVQRHLPGPGWLRGMIWGGVLCLVVGLTVLPLLHGAGIFGSAWDGRTALSLIAWYLLWGCVLGIAYHKPRLS